MKKLASVRSRTLVYWYIKISTNAAEDFIFASLLTHCKPETGLRYLLHKSCDLPHEHHDEVVTL